MAQKKIIGTFKTKQKENGSLLISPKKLLKKLPKIAIAQLQKAGNDRASGTPNPESQAATGTTWKFGKKKIPSNDVETRLHKSEFW